MPNPLKTRRHPEMSQINLGELESFTPFDSDQRELQLRETAKPPPFYFENNVQWERGMNFDFQATMQQSTMNSSAAANKSVR
jgi:hypothetical protein